MLSVPSGSLFGVRGENGDSGRGYYKHERIQEESNHHQARGKGMLVTEEQRRLVAVFFVCSKMSSMSQRYVLVYPSTGTMYPCTKYQYKYTRQTNF